jgi:uncharacterized protein YgiM (DUF1202 family)
MLALIATGLTEASLALGKTQTTSPEPAHKVTTPAVKTTTVKPVAPISAAPTAPVLPTATVNGFVHMRSSPTTSASIIIDLNAGDVVSYSKVDPGPWQSIIYQGTYGYVYNTYLNF